MTKVKRLLWLSLVCAFVFSGPASVVSAEEAEPEQDEQDAPLDLEITDQELYAAIKKYVEANCFAVHEPTVMKLEKGTLAYSRISCDRFGVNSLD